MTTVPVMPEDPNEDFCSSVFYTHKLLIAGLDDTVIYLEPVVGFESITSEDLRIKENSSRVLSGDECLSIASALLFSEQIIGTIASRFQIFNAMVNLSG